MDISEFKMILVKVKEKMKQWISSFLSALANMSERKTIGENEWEAMEYLALHRDE